MRTVSTYEQKVSDLISVVVLKDTKSEPTLFRLGIRKEGDNDGEAKSIYEGDKESCLKILYAIQQTIEEASNDIYQGGGPSGS